MNILVTGAAGLIGSNLVRELKKKHKVVTVDIKGDVDYCLDITTEDLFNITEDIDVIYHLAAQPFSRGSEEDPFKDLEYNAKGTLNVCYFAKEKRVSQIVYTSTMAVYGNNEYANEDSELNPLSNYSVSKLYGEYCIKKFANQEKFTYNIFRLWNTYGPGQDMENPFKGVVSAFCKQVLNSNKVEVTGSLERYRDVIYVSDVVSALIMSLEFQDSNIYNVSTGIKITIRELIDKIIQVVGKSPLDYTITNVGSHLGDQQGCVGNNHKLVSRGWKVNYTLEEGLRKFLEYITKNTNNKSNI